MCSRVLPIRMPAIESEVNELQPLPLILEIALLLIVRLLEAVPVLIVIPRPPYPPVAVALMSRMIFALNVEFVTPVPIVIPAGSPVLRSRVQIEHGVVTHIGVVCLNYADSAGENLRASSSRSYGIRGDR